MTETKASLLSAAMPIAMVYGEPFIQIPQDLYIPPQALEVLLEAFSGPLDLLLYLIRKQDFDILDIPIAEVTHQYMRYIELMQVLAIDLATEYLIMAAVLTEIKSRMLVPKPVLAPSPEEDDPRLELIRRLQEYEQIKAAACALDNLPREGRDVFLAMAHTERADKEISRPTLQVEDLRAALQSVLARSTLSTHHTIKQELLSVRERMSQILHRLSKENPIEFTCLFKAHEGRMGVVVTFIALLELWRQALIELVQSVPLGTIEVSTQ